MLCLASGRYQPFVGAEEADKVTIRAEKGARPRLPFDFDGAANLVLEGLTIPLGRLAGATRDITIRDSAFTGPLTIEGLADANVLLEHNTHLDIDAPPGASPARIHLNYSARAPSGVTIRDSLFAGGDADGIQTGVGVDIVDNEFRDILEKGPNHTDAIQLIGARGSVIRGNYIHDSSSGIVAYDGVSHVTIEDNVVALAGRPWAVELYSDAGSVVRHNTLAPGACDYDLPCGILEVNRKPGDPRGRGTEVTANIAADISIQNGSTLARPEREPARRLRGARRRRGRDARLRGRRAAGPLGRVPARRLVPRRRDGVRRRGRRHPRALTRRASRPLWTHWTH